MKFRSFFFWYPFRSARVAALVAKLPEDKAIHLLRKLAALAMLGGFVAIVLVDVAVPLPDSERLALATGLLAFLAVYAVMILFLRKWLAGAAGVAEQGIPMHSLSNDSGPGAVKKSQAPGPGEH